MHGAPGSGKTTLARALAAQLGLPVFGKDELKEALYESLGIGDAAWSRTLGTAVYELLWLLAREQLTAGASLVLEGNFVAGDAERSVAGHPRHRAVRVYCEAPEPVLVARYLARRRHPGHLDLERLEEVRANIRTGRHRPLELDGELIEVDTTRPVDVADLARRLA